VIQRFAAVAAAIALVAAAFVIRENVIENDGGDSNGSGDAPVVCVRELPDVCADEAPVGETFDALVAGEQDRIVWVTPGPWPQMANDSRSFASEAAAFETTTVVASTPLVIVVRRLPAECGTTITWRCLGDAARARTSRIAGPSAASPYRLLARAAFLTGYFDRSDYASNDVNEDAAVSDWIVGVEREIDRARSFGATSVADFVAKQGSADVFISIGVEAQRYASTTVEVATPTPVVRVDAVVGSEGDPPRGVGDALIERGWDEPAGPQDDDGLPSPGVLLALREVVS